MVEELHKRNCILCLRGPNLYGFVHRTFLEYLIATECVERFCARPQQMAMEKLLDRQREHVVEWGVAPRRHGGDGALVVFLRQVVAE